MAIKLPETKVFTRDQLRAQYMAQQKTFTKKVEDAVLDLSAHHRPRYESLLFKGWWDDIQRFIESRQPNGTPFDKIVAAEREGHRTDYLSKGAGPNDLPQPIHHSAAVVLEGCPPWC